MNVKEVQFQSTCRTCLSEKGNLKDIFKIADILMSFTTIQIEQGDGLPATICTECLSQVTQAYEFRLLCEQSDTILREKLINQHVVYIKTDRYENELLDVCSETSSSAGLDMHEKNGMSLNSNHSQISLEDLPDINIRKRTRCRKTKKKGIYKEDTRIKKENSVDDFEEEMKNVFVSENSTSEEDENDTELSCKFCDLKFRYKIRLKKHEQKHLTGLKCHLCDKDFSTIKQLTNHINIHSRKGAHLCQVCGKQFTLPENLVRHQRIHNGIKPYKCTICNKSFIQSNELKSHLITHSSEKHHLCNICGNKYARLISLRVHMRRIHSIPPNHRPFICTICGRNFKDRRDLSQHMQIHTGERSHICGVCGKAFNRSSNLRVHERIHSGQKPHVCPVCQRAFIQKHVLITHMRTHPQVGHPSEQNGEQTGHLHIPRELHLPMQKHVLATVNISCAVLFYLFGVIVMIQNFSKISIEADKTINIMNEIRFKKWYTVNFRRWLPVHILRLKHQKIIFTAWDLFSVDYTLLYAVIAATSAYLIIIIQASDTENNQVSEFDELKANSTISG